MAIDIKKEVLVRLSKVPDWYEEHAGFRPNRSTVQRWRKIGARGAKLETILIGGQRFTSEEKLQLFSSGNESAAIAPTVPSDSAVDAFLEAEGI